jgi:hypothetical protein
MSLWARIVRFLFGWAWPAIADEYPTENGDGEPVHWIDGEPLD